MKLKCLAKIATVYLQNDESVVGEESIQKPPMESRETRAQSRTREDLNNGENPLRFFAPDAFPF